MPNLLTKIPTETTTTLVGDEQLYGVNGSGQDIRFSVTHATRGIAGAGGSIMQAFGDVTANEVVVVMKCLDDSNAIIGFETPSNPASLGQYKNCIISVQGSGYADLGVYAFDGVGLYAGPIAARLLVAYAHAPAGRATLRLVGQLTAPSTITAAATTGAQTINKMSGTVNFAATATSLVVTNNLVTANSVILATVATNDTTMHSVKAVAASGSFTLHASAAATAETRVNWAVLNKGD